MRVVRKFLKFFLLLLALAGIYITAGLLWPLDRPQTPDTDAGVVLRDINLVDLETGGFGLGNIAIAGFDRYGRVLGGRVDLPVGGEALHQNSRAKTTPNTISCSPSTKSTSNCGEISYSPA